MILNEKNNIVHNCQYMKCKLNNIYKNVEKNKIHLLLVVQYDMVNTVEEGSHERRADK